MGRLTELLTTMPPYSWTPLVESVQRKTGSLLPSADGSCLFNAISVALTGNEHLAVELRVRCCIELVMNIQHYVLYHKGSDFPLVCPAYKKSALDCACSSSLFYCASSLFYCDSQPCMISLAILLCKPLHTVVICGQICIDLVLISTLNCMHAVHSG